MKLSYICATYSEFIKSLYCFQKTVIKNQNRKNAARTQVISMYTIPFLAYVVALISNSLLIVALLRQKVSYFKDVKRYFVATHLAFVALILSDAFMSWFPSEATVVYATKIGISACISAVATMGLCVAILYRRVKLGSQKVFNVRDALKGPFALIHHGFLLAVLILTWVIPFQIKQMIDLISGELIYIPEYEFWYTICLFLILVSLFAYPCSLLFLISRTAKAGKAARASMGLGVCWATVGISTFTFAIILQPMGFDALWLGHLISTVFFGVIVQLFRRTTVLESLLGEMYPPVGLVREGEAAIVLYTPSVDKMRAFSAFIREGIVNGDRIAYIYPDEESEFVRFNLAKYGVDVDKYEKDGTLFMKSLSEFFMPDGNFDKERPIRFLLDRRAEAKRKGCKAREIEDVGDFSFVKGRWQEYFDYWSNPMWGLSETVGIIFEPFIMEVTAVNVGGMSEVQRTEILKAFGSGRVAPARLIDVIEHRDGFSKSVGLTHKQMLGRKVLLEFDPASTYEVAIEDLVKECMANVEPILIFTPRGSVIHTSLTKQPVKFFLTSGISAPKILSENEVLLPANNPPLVLDSLDRMLKAYPHGGVCLVFDIFSDLLMSVGFEKTYKFLQYALEMLYSERVTAVFLLNSAVHDPKIVSSLRGLFANRIAYRKEGIRVLRLPRAE